MTPLVDVIRADTELDDNPGAGQVEERLLGTRDPSAIAVSGSQRRPKRSCMS